MSFKNLWKKDNNKTKYILFGFLGGAILLVFGLISFFLILITGNEIFEVLLYQFIIAVLLVKKLYPNISAWGGFFAGIFYGLIINFIMGFLIGITIFHFKFKNK